MAIKLFASQRLAEFATSLLKAAGYELEPMATAGDACALKTAIDQKLAAAGPKEGMLTEAQAMELTDRISQLEAENTTLKSSLKNFEAADKALAGHGIKISDAIDAKDGFKPELLDAAFDLTVAKASRIALARAGHDPLDPEVRPAKPEAKRAPEGLTGSARLSWDFHRQVREIRRREAAQN